MDISIRKWHTKIIYIIFALALALGLTMVPALPAGAHTAVHVTVNFDTGVVDGFADPPMNVDVRVQVDDAIGDVDYYFDWEYKQNEGDFHGYQNLNQYEFPLLFTDDIDRYVYDEDNNITESWTLAIPGWYRVSVTAWDDGGDLAGNIVEVRVLGIIPEDIAFDVKGGQQEIAVKGMTDNATIE